MIEIVGVKKRPYGGFVYVDRFGEGQGFSGIERQALAQGIVPALDVNRSTRRFPATPMLVYGHHSGIRFPAIGVDLSLTIAGRKSVPPLAGRGFRAVAQSRPRFGESAGRRRFTATPVWPSGQHRAGPHRIQARVGLRWPAAVRPR